MCRQYCSNIYAFVNFQLFQGCNVFRSNFELVAWMEARPRWPGWVLVTCSCITRRLKAKATQGQVGLDNHHKGYRNDHQHYHSASRVPPLKLVTINILLYVGNWVNCTAKTVCKLEHSLFPNLEENIPVYLVQTRNIAKVLPPD